MSVESIYGGSSISTYRHGEVAEIAQAAKAKDVLELLHCLSVVALEQIVHIVDYVVDPRNAILRPILLDWVVPLWIPMNGVYDTRSTNAPP